MATYKVIQDIEAEDKLLGPLTLKQCIFAIVVIVCGFVAFKLGTVAWYLALPFLPPMLVFGLLAAPFGRDQPTEIWLLAKLRFLLKPRQRIWDQSGQIDLVTITAPKKIDPASFTNQLTQTEVKSRLKALGETIDSRGWAVKHVNENLFNQPANLGGLQTQGTSDRLLEITTLPEVDSLAVQADEDILDEQNNPVAQQLDQMIGASTQAHRQQTLANMQKVREKLAKIKQVRAEPDSSNYWFMGQTASLGPQNSSAVFQNQNFSATTTAEVSNEQAVLAKAADQKSKQEAAYANLHSYDPSNSSPQMTAPPDPAILGLANNDDLTVATIARQANHKDLPDNEVTVSLR